MTKRWLVCLLILVFAFVAPAMAEKKKSAKKSLTAEQNSAVNSILAGDHVRNAKTSIKVVSLKTGQTLFQKNSNQLVIPASTNKALTSAAALDILGPEYRFTTEVRYDGKLQADGTLTGNLYIVGGGDPSLSLEQTWLLAHRIRSYGVKKVNGKLIGDESAFDSVRHYPEWGKVGTRAYEAPMGALSVNFNTLGVHVAPGGLAGAPGTATLDPATDLLKLENHLLTVAEGRTRVAISVREDKCIVSGQIPAGVKGTTYYRSIGDPLPFALSAIKTFLAQEDVTVLGGYTGGVTPDKSRLLFVHESKPLALIVRDLLRSSNNFTAEQIARTIGAYKDTPPATQKNASAAVINWLKEKNLYDLGVAVSDGSGLARDNKLSAKVLVDVLSYMWNKPEIGPEYVDAMAKGGVDGTLKRRFRNTPLQARVRAKSGLLWGVITLTGYAYDTSGEPYAFAILVNDYSAAAGARDIQQIAERLLNVMMK
jgi:serine-type D-Ala-D-Ala carboxypeptidase/endopeptidase (penicillin-binding protein 4)